MIIPRYFVSHKLFAHCDPTEETWDNSVYLCCFPEIRLYEAYQPPGYFKDIEHNTVP